MRSAPGCDMPGHLPYDTWHVYYYYRPYQAMHVDELLNGLTHFQSNSFANEVFCKIHGEHAVALESENPRHGYLEYASCIEPIGNNRQPQFRGAIQPNHPDEFQPQMHFPQGPTRVPEQLPPQASPELPLELGQPGVPRPPSFPSTTPVPERAGNTADLRVIDPATLRVR